MGLGLKGQGNRVVEKNQRPRGRMTSLTAKDGVISVAYLMNYLTMLRHDLSRLRSTKEHGGKGENECQTASFEC